MTRATLAATLLAVVLAGGFIIGAVNQIAEDTWP